MDQIWGARYWNWNTTWYTDDPDFTHYYFENSVLVDISCAFLWAGSTVDFLCSASQCPKIPRTKLSFCKKVSTMLIIIISIIHGVYDYLNHEEIGKHSSRLFLMYHPILKVLTLILALDLQIFFGIRGKHSTGIQFVFWLLFSITESIHLHSDIKHSSGRNEYNFVINEIFRGLVFFMVALNCLSDNSATPAATFTKHSVVSSDNSQEINNPHPELGATYLSRLAFSWVGSLVRKGYQSPLKFQDLWNLRHEDTTNYLYSTFLKNTECGKTNVVSKDKNNYTANVNFLGNNQNQRIFFTIILPLGKTFGRDILIILLLAISADVTNILMTQVLSFIIHFITNCKDENGWTGFFWAVVMFLAALSQTLLNHHTTCRVWFFINRLRATISYAIYRKSLLISNLTRAGTSVGSIMNIMSVDADKLQSFARLVPVIITAPVSICLVLYFLYCQLGIAAFSGLIILVLLSPVNILATKKMKSLQSNQMKKKDERIKKLLEILSGIKIVKLYAWEPTFLEQVNKVRNEEIDLLQRKAYVNAVHTVVWNLSPVLVTLISFATFILIEENNTLDTQNAFVSLSLINILTKPLADISHCISAGVDAYVSLKRVSDFLNSSEKCQKSVTYSSVGRKDEKNAITVEKGNFSWDRESLTLKNISVKIKKGSLVAIVGPVGSGKSSFLQSLLGEIEKMNGSVFVKGSLAYVPQQPWIQNATVEENITFGLPLVSNKYKKVIDSCALTPDLEILPGNDQTEIGEKGINLSGGQKARVALARAAYLNADVYLLDDPLSAVDSHVGKHIFENLIGPAGILKGKTRILITHQISHLHEVDKIIVLTDGQISDFGSYTDLRRKKGAFSDFLAQYTRNIATADDQNNESYSIDSESIENCKDRKTISIQRPVKINKQETNLIKEECPEIGNVKFNVIKNYLHFVGQKNIALIIGAFILSQGFAVCSNMWLSSYVKQGTSDGNDTLWGRKWFVGVYALLGLCQCIFIFSAFCFVFLGTLKASKELHSNMLLRIFRAPMYFFDTTPLGRIINRFSTDIQGLDQELPHDLTNCLLYFFKTISVFFVATINFPILSVVILIIVPIYFMIQRYFVVVTRQLYRLNSVARSPIYSHFSETLSGITTIRAFNAQQRFIQECERKMDIFQTTMIPLTMTRRWLSVRLQALSSFFLFCSATLCVIYRKEISPSLAGFIISYAMRIPLSFLYVVIHSASVETQIVAAERVMEYTEVVQESVWTQNDSKTKMEWRKSWPEKGRIVFKNYQTRYRPGTDIVLKNITCNIKPGEKIGIVGRTGAGKSSLTLGLFRIIEAQKGSIWIDGVDISTLGLHDIRGRLTIIPQDPILFSGTIRFNLDPLSKYNDEALWKALELAHLKSFVEELSLGLDYIVSENGGNLSVGQCQLICLSKAILRKSKILVLDEATAAVDLETDDLIQKTIRKEFKDCTVLIVAHRLNTILDCDRIMVLAEGRTSEFDSPKVLLTNHKSKFYEMAKNAGFV